MNRWWPLLLPELRRWPEPDREHALQRARDTPLDLLELLGMAIGLVVVTSLTRHLWDFSSLAGRLGSTLLNLAAAMPLLVLLLGPFHIRRLRRGLRELPPPGPALR